MKSSDLERELDRKEIRPLYFLHGEETYLLEKIRKRIVSLCLAGKMRDFNFDVFLGGETPPERIVDAAKTLPMMAPWRVVVVRDAHLFNAQEIKNLIPYCEDPSPTTCLILSGESLGSWKKHLDLIGKKGRVVAFTHPRGTHLTRYIVEETEQQGKRITPEAAGVIGELVGNRLGEVHQELGKVVSYVGDREEIGIDDIDAVISPVKSHTVFDLTRAVGMKNCSDALRILNRMLEGGEPPLMILGMVTRQFRLIWRAKAMRARGISDGEIGKAVSIPDFFLKGFLPQLKNFTPEDLNKGYHRLLETDKAIKSRSTSKRILLEHLVISLCR
jgi:DNA polymerase-3 subunit delta